MDRVSHRLCSSRFLRSIALVGLWGCSGCYKTLVRAPQDQMSVHMFEDRQWFAFLGLATLSSEPGQECTAGFSFVESRMAALDVVIAAGLAVAGGLVGALACPLDQNPSDRDKIVFAACAAGLSAGFPLVFGTRTIRYRCNDPRVALY